MKEDLISVVVPVYNVEKYLKKCVDSILKQSYKNLEIILVDDGSTDNSGVICDDYINEDKRIKVYHKDNGGLSSARNYGIDRMNGKYVTFIDSDDFIDKFMIEELYKCLIDNDLDISLCHGLDYNDYNFEGTNEKSLNINVKMYNREESLLNCNSTLFIVAYQKLYKSELFKSLRYEDGVIHEDAQIAPYIYDQVNKIGLIDQTLYYRYIRDDSIVHKNFSKKNYDVIKVAEDRLNFYLKNKYEFLYNQGYTFLLGAYVILYVKAHSSNILKQEKKSIISNFRKEYKKYRKFLTFGQRLKYGFFYIFPNICISMIK